MGSNMLKFKIIVNEQNSTTFILEPKVRTPAKIDGLLNIFTSIMYGEKSRQFVGTSHGKTKDILIARITPRL